jgi:hypothetical protein
MSSAFRGIGYLRGVTAVCHDPRRRGVGSGIQRRGLADRLMRISATRNPVFFGPGRVSAYRDFGRNDSRAQRLKSGKSGNSVL